MATACPSPAPQDMSPHCFACPDLACPAPSALGATGSRVPPCLPAVKGEAFRTDHIYVSAEDRPRHQSPPVLRGGSVAARTQIILTTRFLSHAVVHPGVFQWPRREGGPAWCFPGVCAWRTWSDRCYILLMSRWGVGVVRRAESRARLPGLESSVRRLPCGRGQITHPLCARPFPAVSGCHDGTCLTGLSRAPLP